MGLDLQAVDPEIVFFHPSNELKVILRRVSINYDKHWKQMQSIVSGILLEDIMELIDNKHCNSFALLVSEIEREYDELLRLAVQETLNPSRLLAICFSSISVGYYKCSNNLEIPQS